MKHELADVISLLDRRKSIEQGKNAAVYHGEYPIFEGKILNVGPEIFDKDRHLTVISYLPPGRELPKPDLGRLLLPDLKGDYVVEHEAECQKLIEKVVVPFSVNPAVFTNARVKGSIKEVQPRISAYVLEVLVDEKELSAVNLFLGHSTGSRFAGFQYIVVLP